MSALYNLYLAKSKIGQHILLNIIASRARRDVSRDKLNNNNGFTLQN